MDACFFGAVILLETVTYTMSFLISGLAKKDIFNRLEGKETTLGISSLPILILLNTAIPLIINLVKQINSGLAAKVESSMRKNIKAELLSKVINQRLGAGKSRKYGETVSLYRNCLLYTSSALRIRCALMRWNMAGLLVLASRS